MTSLLCSSYILSFSSSQIDPETRPAALGPPFTGHFRVLVDTPRGLQPLHPGTSRPEEKEKEGKVKAESSTNKNPLSMELRKTIYHTTSSTLKPISNSLASTLAATSDAALKPSSGENGQENGKETQSYSCNTCSSDCTSSRFHSIRVKNFQLCGGCFSEGRFPTSMFSGDFVRVDDRRSFKHGQKADEIEEDHDWSDIETLRLLEGLELYDEDWGKVSEHVGSRSREECITRFLQMPIEDKWLEETEAVTSNGVKNGDRNQVELGPLSILKNSATGLTPFTQADNPVMSVVAFLASNVSPAVAAAAAKRAIGEIGKGVRKREAEKGDGNEKESKKAKEGEMEVQDDGTTEKEKEKDAMDVDQVETEGEKEGEKEKENGVDESTTDLPPMASLASLALGAAAAKAHVLSAFEERECQSLVAQCVSAQMKKMEVSVLVERSSEEEREEIFSFLPPLTNVSFFLLLLSSNPFSSKWLTSRN